jgi:hypothetical protein
MASGLQIFGPDGTITVDTDSSVGLVLGIVTIGGEFDQSPTGSVADSRISLGWPYAVVTNVEVNSFIGYMPTIWFNGTTVQWSWPPQYGDGQGGVQPYPRARFIYGLK